MRYVNYHKHTHYSNIRTLDCVSKPEDYIKRAVELGHKEYVTTEHGYQGNIFEAQTLCEKYGIKCIYGVEAYYVDDMLDKSSRSMYHIMLVALTEKARKEINRIMSTANQDGFYYKPRIDLKSLLSLTPTDTVVTTACIGGRLFKGDDWENAFLLPVMNHFGKNFFLEVQAHAAQQQVLYNMRILQLKEKYGLQLIHANDSHYIYPHDAKFRDLFLRAKGIYYEEESGFELDYPSAETILERYIHQGVLSREQALEALNNTLIFDQAESIHVDKEFKIPKIKEELLRQDLHLPNFDYSDDNKVLRAILSRAWRCEKGRVKAKRIPEYQQAIYYETDIVEKCGMSRYFIVDHLIVKKAVNEYGAVLTRSGRGSAVSFYINHLLGLTEIDRLTSPITLYPTRFMSAERILSSRSLPDIDLNFASVEPVIQASKDILGEEGVYYMVAYKPLQESSAFRLWCKANGYNLEEYDEIAKNLEDHLEDKRWQQVIEDSKVFRGVIESIAPSPCSFLLLDRPIPDEVGLIRVGNATNYVMCCALDGYNCDVYKYLKNDYLVVRVWDIIDRVYKLIGRPIDDIDTLLSKCDDKVWDIYANALTTTINQSDSDFGKQTLKRYKPKSLAEMSAWVAAIRPGFASLLNTFLDRIPYSTGVAELDAILEDSFHFMMYQESIMKYLVWLGIEEKGTYDIIKKIAKKKFKEEELQALQQQLESGWIKNVGSMDGFAETWQVVQDAARYSFNASHSLSVAIDSVYGAYLKSHYPLEYYTVVLTLYADDMARTANLIAELPYFGIELKPIKFGKSGADYSMDKSTNSIYKGISSVKFCNSEIADQLLALSQNHYPSFIELLADIKAKTSVNARQLMILTGLNFFSDFGGNQYLMKAIEIYDEFASSKIIAKKKIQDYEFKFGLSELDIRNHSNKETAAQYRELDNMAIIQLLLKKIPNKPMQLIEQIKFDMEYLEYTTYINPACSPCFYVVVDFKTYSDPSRPSLLLRQIQSGKEIKTRIKQGRVYRENPFGEFAMLKIESFSEVPKIKLVGGDWVKTDEVELVLEYYEVMKNNHPDKLPEAKSKIKIG